jgi:two-component system cell cycle sensor histidine kinase/response regulator CckA
LRALASSERKQSSATHLLAYGISHEYSNLTTGGIAIADALEKNLQAGTEPYELASKLKRSLMASARLTDHFIKFNEGLPKSAEPINVNLLVESAMKMLRHVLDRHIRLDVRLDSALNSVRVNTVGLEAVVAALVMRAGNVLKDDGTLTVSTTLARFDDRYATRFIDLAAGDYVVVTISDSGPSVAPEALSSTELSEAYTIVAALGGQIDIVTASARGSSFAIHLPIGFSGSHDVIDADEGKWHVLLVEDNEIVMSGLRSALTRRDYRVTTALRAEDAIKRFPDAAGFDILVTDIVMERMNGVQLAGEFRKKRRDLLVVFMSGYSLEAGLDPVNPPAGTTFISKPFTPDQLVNHIVALLPDRRSMA